MSNRTKTVIKNGISYEITLMARGVIYVNNVKILITEHRNLADIKLDISRAIDKYNGSIVSKDAWDLWNGKLD